MPAAQNIMPSTIPLAAKLSREDIAKMEIGHTCISGALAWSLCGMFLVTIFAVPLVQQAWELRERSNSTQPLALPQSFDILAVVPAAARTFESTPGTFIDRVIAANRVALAGIHQYEQQLEDDSLLGRALLPITQFVLTKYLGAGNEEAYVGRDGWLFYRPDVDSIAGPPFLALSNLRRRRQAATPIHPDPRQAILEFHQQLAERGARLVIMPTPAKPSIHPEKFSARLSPSDAPLVNASQEELIADLRAQGVLVFDPTDALLSVRRSEAPAYLETDTHWTPAAVEATATALAKWINERELLPASSSLDLRRDDEQVANLGDIAVMLRLPQRQTTFKPQEVQLQPVTTAVGESWCPARSADVLLLGDSFTNIFSLGSMGWGESAGFAEQLSFALQRPLDRIAQNDAGAHATRQALSRELALGRDRLAGKRLVIWQFAAREFANGDWKLLPMELGNPPPASFLVAPAGGEMVVSGTIASASPAPRPGRVPYKDHILAMHLVDVEIRSPATASSAANNQGIVYSWSMRDAVRQAPATYREGQRLTLRLRPWSDVESRYGAINRTELDDLELQLEAPNWGEVIP